MFHVEKSYARDAQALVEVNLHVQKGEMVFLSGPSGAGKSTLMKLIFGAEEPTRGQIIVAGRNVGRIRSSAWPYLRRNIGVVFQDFKLLPTRTVADNVAYTLQVVGCPPREVARRVQRVLAAVGLEHKAAALPPRLSGGEQQRVAIARALVNDPMIFIADEPTGNLDEKLSLEIMDLIDGIHARGTTVLVATHDREIIERRRRRVVTLDHGRIVSDVGAELDERHRAVVTAP